MKTFLIFLLSALLAGGAFLSRPTMDEFRAYAAKTGGVTNTSGQASTDGLAYNDCYLWSVVEKNGKTLYVGVFSRWFSHDLFSGGK